MTISQFELVCQDSNKPNKRLEFGLFTSHPGACEDLLHASTPPQVETARAYELAKCRGNERWPPSPPDRRDRSRSPRGRSTTRRAVTAPLRYSLRQEWNLSLGYWIRKPSDALLPCSRAQSPRCSVLLAAAMWKPQERDRTPLSLNYSGNTPDQRERRDEGNCKPIFREPVKS